VVTAYAWPTLALRYPKISKRLHTARPMPRRGGRNFRPHRRRRRQVARV